jgi:HD superfamily phosphohydrolase
MDGECSGVESRLTAQTSATTGMKKKWTPNYLTQRSVNDVVHKSIPLYYPLTVIIDTPQFQRLRRLKQLNACSWVFPSGEHTRFTHSLGTYHLAREAVSKLALLQPELNIDGTDILCVITAALVHDLGHGPFSHLYDAMFVNAVHPNNDWRHERGSVLMFREMCKKPEVSNALNEFLSAEDYIFIEELIDPPKHFMEGGEWQLKGRPKEKSFLYDFVSNVHDGQDVDKFDYFMRDSHLGTVAIAFDEGTVKRIRCNTRAEFDEEKGYRRLAYNEKIVQDLKNISKARIRLHEAIYQHKTCVAADLALVEAMQLADDHIFFKGDDGVLYRMSEAYKNMTAFLKLDDGVESMIRSSSDERLDAARQALERLDNRHLPKFVGTSLLANVENKAPNAIKQSIIAASGGSLSEHSLIVRVLSCHGGMGVDHDPLEKVLLFDKNFRLTKRSPPVEPTRGGHKFAFIYVPYGTSGDAERYVKLALAKFDPKWLSVVPANKL